MGRGSFTGKIVGAVVAGPGGRTLAGPRLSFGDRVNTRCTAVERARAKPKEIDPRTRSSTRGYAPCSGPWQTVAALGTPRFGNQRIHEISSMPAFRLC